jgi:hypothetical protein
MTEDRLQIADWGFEIKETGDRSQESESRIEVSAFVFVFSDT